MTKTKENTVLFDPGFAQHTTILSISSQMLYAELNTIKNFSQKKMRFKMLCPKLNKMIESNIGFCLGSILWAAYIKTFAPAQIEGNPCLGDKYDENETVEEIDFSVKFFDKMKKDYKYYLNENYETNPLYITILDLYREFLILNKNFVNTKTTSDIVLPENISIPDFGNSLKIKEKIDNVVKSGNLIALTEVLDLVYKG